MVLLAAEHRGETQTRGLSSARHSRGLDAPAVLDAIENVGLLITLSDPAHVGGLWPGLAAACAAPKFLLVILALLYSLAGGVAWLLRRRPA